MVPLVNEAVVGMGWTFLSVVIFEDSLRVHMRGCDMHGVGIVEKSRSVARCERCGDCSSIFFPPLFFLVLIFNISIS